MIFNSYAFLAFFPIVTLAYYLMPMLARRPWLLAASYYFYMCWNAQYALLIAASTLVTYLCALALGRMEAKAGRRAVLALGLAINLGILCFFKYFGFFTDTFARIAARLGVRMAIPAFDVLLPVGISFYTFQSMGYLLDVYNGKYAPQKNLARFALFVSFFPQLIQGPIGRYDQLEKQLEGGGQVDVPRAFLLMLWGLAKKMIVADRALPMVSAVFDAPGGTWGGAMAVVGVLAYSVQQYCDFSGGIDLVAGIAELFGIRLAENFRRPYFAVSLGDFWRRWHITLGRALQSYVYFPLGGSRAGKLRTYRNLLITFLVSGLWHGAAWTFVLWGALHGLFNALERVFAKPLSRVPHWVRVGCTFLIVNALWVLFRAESFQSAATVYRGMADFSNLAFAQVGTLALDGFVGVPNLLNAIYVVGILAALAVVCFRCKNSCQMLENFTCRKGALWATAILFCIALVHLSRESVFIYFNF